jgi:hypothetical protein
MNKPALIALLLALSATSVFGQSLRVAGARAASTQPRVAFRGYPGRRSLIGLTGPPLRDTAGRRSYARNGFFYGDFPYGTSDYANSYPPEIVVQEPMPAVPVTAPVIAPKEEPVPSGALLELQGNHWVKVSSFAMGTSEATSATAGASRKQPITPVEELPATVIVFRDGRSEELSGYSIIGSTLYAKADYFSTGEWTRKIPLATIDIAATTKQNQDRGVKFDLPSGPNEIVLRP